MTPGGMVEVRVFDTADGLYDCCWSEVGHVSFLNALLACLSPPCWLSLVASFPCGPAS